MGVLPATRELQRQRRVGDGHMLVLLLLLPHSPISWVTFSAMFSVGACVAAAFPLIFFVEDCAAPCTQDRGKAWPMDEVSLE
jgi:hypothetical protein